MTFDEWKAAVDRPGVTTGTLGWFFTRGYAPETAAAWLDTNPHEVDSNYRPPRKVRTRKPGRPQVEFTKAMMQRAMLRGALRVLVPFQLKKIAPADSEWYAATLAKMKKVLDAG